MDKTSKFYGFFPVIVVLVKVEVVLVSWVVIVLVVVILVFVVVPVSVVIVLVSLVAVLVFRRVQVQESCSVIGLMFLVPAGDQSF